MLYEWFEVPVAEQERKITFNASGCNERIYGFSYRYTMCSQNPEIACRLNGNVLSAQLHHRQGSQEFARLVKVSIAIEPLKHLGQDQVAHCQGLASQ